MRFTLLFIFSGEKDQLLEASERVNIPIPDRVYRLRYGPPTLGACIGALIFFGIWEGISYAIDAIKKASEWRKHGKTQTKKWNISSLMMTQKKKD